ncbi:MAG: hypothetical protein LBL50_03675 [Candidatus Margulisbacteria bacterium]|jgi:hypothetical protein|nr:hypothetical protein [Candidatus Margulisiibacteriota bacterium]
MATTENTAVELQIKPQVKAPLPEVRLKPAPASNNTSELVTHLLLQRFNKLQTWFEQIKNKILAVSFMQKIFKLKQNLTDYKKKYADKEKLGAQTAQLKAQALTQPKGLLEKFNKQFQFGAKLTKINDTVGKDALKHLFQNKIQRAVQAKLAQVKEDIQEIQTRGQNILNSSLRNSLDKKKQSK